MTASSLIKLFFLVSCAALKECGDSTTIYISKLPVNCEKLNGSLNVFHSSEYDSTREFQLQEVTDDFFLNADLPSVLKKLSKSKRFTLGRYAAAKNNNFSQIAAEELKFYTYDSEDVTVNMEPSSLIVSFSKIRTISGLKGSRLNHVKLESASNLMSRFNVSSLDYLSLDNWYPALFPDLKYVKHFEVSSLSRTLNVGIYRAGKIEIRSYEGKQVELPNLSTVDEYIKVSDRGFSFSAPQLSWGRLDFRERMESLELNKSLRWNGTAVFNSKDFCDKYLVDFANSGQDFIYPPCKVDCSNLSTPYLHKFNESCEKIGAIEINQSSPKLFSLKETTTINGDLIINNYTGLLYIPKLNEITGNLIISNSNNFIAENIKKIQGSLTIHNSSSLNIPNLIEITGNLTIINSNSFSVPSLEVSGTTSIDKSNNFSLVKLKEIKGDLEIMNSTFSFDQALFDLNKVNTIHLQHQTNNIEFKSLTSINFLRIGQSSLKEISGIDTTSLGDLFIEDCVELTSMPLKKLKTIDSIYIDKVGFNDLAYIFPGTVNATNNITIMNFLHDRMYLHVIAASQIILKDNSKLEIIRLKAKQLKSPIININNPRLRVVSFKDMEINYRLQNNIFKVFAASTAKELQPQGNMHNEATEKKVQNQGKVFDEDSAELFQRPSDPNAESKIHTNIDITPKKFKDMDPKTKKILKIYIMFVLPSAALATISIIFYLK